MRKVLSGLALFTALVLLSSASHSALAQGVKKDKDAKEKDAKVTKGATGTVEINEGKDGKFRFVVRNSDGKFLAMSGPTGFATKKDAEEALAELKEVIAKAKVVAGKKADPKAKDKDKEKDK